MDQPFSKKLAYNMNEVAQITGISRTRLYIEIAGGRLSACKIGSRTIVRHDDLQAFMVNLQPVRLANSK